MLFALFALPFLSVVKGFDTASNKNDVNYAIKFQKKYERYRTDCGQGEYMNLCAECVSGQTEKEDDFGTDSCGVCGGLDTCNLQCTDPMADIDEDPGVQAGCTKLVSVTPSILDLAESREGAICIFGDGISPESLTSVECVLKKDETNIVKFRGEVLEDSVELRFPLPEVGDYELACNTSVRAELNERITVVDSAALQPMPLMDTLFTWKPYEVKLTVGQLRGPEAVLCFGRAEGRLVYREWSAAVQGNGLSSTVVCPGVVLLRPGQLEFGVAYSLPATKSAKTIKITGVALSPKPISATYISKKSKVEIIFDQNLDEDNLKDCGSIFKETSLAVFGRDPLCEALANKVMIEIRDKSALANTVLQFSDNVRTKFSQVSVEGSVHFNYVKHQGTSEARLEGARKVCPGESSEVTLTGGTTGWEVSAVPQNLSGVPPGQRQRLNMMAWRLNRSSRAAPKAFTFTSTQKMAGMKYQVQAKKAGIVEDKIDVSVANPGEVWANLEGPSELNLASSALFQAHLKACGQTPHPSKYIWDITSLKGEVIDTSLQNGPKLQLDGSLLQPNEEYKISVKIMDGEKILGSDDLTIKTSINIFELNLPETNIVVGTGHSIEIDASKAINVNEKLIKFKWTCTKGYCFEPGKDKKPLKNMETFSQPVLRLPPKSLAVGKYVFEVEGVTEFGKAHSELEVKVISGQPPYFSRLSASDLDPGKDLAITLVVSEIMGRCEFYWEAVPEFGLAYISINQTSTTVRATPHSPGRQDLKLTLLRSSLKPGAQYKIRCIADCGRLTQSHFQFQIFIPERFPEFTLEVEPKKGNALETNFTFNILHNESEANYLFSYGFEEKGISKFLFTSHKEVYTTVLGHGSYKGIVKICRTNLDCITVYGPEITTAAANTLSETSLRQTLKTYSDLILSNSFSEANTFLEMAVPALKENDLTNFENFSHEVQNFLINRIDIYTERLKSDSTYLEDAVKLLDAATTAYTLLANSDEAMSALLKFKDLIHQETQLLTGKKTENKLSSNLPAEHRDKDSEVSRPKRKTIPKYDPETTVNAIFKLASSLSNIKNHTDQQIQGKIQILNDIITYATQFCNALDESPTKEAGSENEFALIESRNLKSKEEIKNIKFPLCSKSQCPNITAHAKVVPVNSTKDGNKSEGFCFSNAYLRDDFLSDVSPPPSLNYFMRWSPIYWLDLHLYNNGVVDSHVSYSSLVPAVNISGNSSVASNTSSSLVNKGSIIIQMPLWDKPLPKGTILKCSRYENKSWNFSSCGKKDVKKELPNKVYCVCPYPGFFSVFAVFRNQSQIGTSKESTPVVTVPSIPPTISTPTTTTQNSKQTANTSLSTTNENKEPGKSNVSEFSTPTVLATVMVPTRVTSNATLATKVEVATKATAVEAASKATGVDITTKAIVVEVTTKTAVTMPVPANETKPTEATQNTTNATLIESRKSSGLPNGSEFLFSTTIPKPQEVTPNGDPPSHYKFSAYFRINESFEEKVGDNEQLFSKIMENQLKTIVNITLPTSVETEDGKIKVTLKIEENKLSEENHHLASLAGHLRNGTLLLRGLGGEVLTVPKQELHLLETNKHVSSATTAFISVIFVFLLLLIGSLIVAVYLRNTREQRSLRLTQDLYEEPPAPKYLRLHDSVSLGSSGPSSPSLANEMESSLAVVTRPRNSGYESVDQFSNLPGNI